MRLTSNRLAKSNHACAAQPQVVLQGEPRVCDLSVEGACLVGGHGLSDDIREAILE
jgi:hypothetical protein